MSDTSNSYPTSLNSFNEVRATGYLVTAANWNAFAGAINALETKIGTGASTPTANKVLRATGTGTSAWGQVAAGDYAAGSIVNADISASAAIAASKLADYADTTWTPVIAGDATAGTNTYSLQAGFYMRLGNLVIATFFVTMTAKDAAMAGNIYVSLPVTVRNTSNMFFSGALRQSNITLAAGYTWLTCTPTPNTTRAFIQQSGSGVAVANIAAAGIAAGTSIIGTAVYFA